MNGAVDSRHHGLPRVATPWPLCVLNKPTKRSKDVAPFQGRRGRSSKCREWYNEAGCPLGWSLLCLNGCILTLVYRNKAGSRLRCVYPGLESFIPLGFLSFYNWSARPLSRVSKRNQVAGRQFSLTRQGRIRKRKRNGWFVECQTGQVKHKGHAK